MSFPKFMKGFYKIVKLWSNSKLLMSFQKKTLMVKLYEVYEI